MNAHDGNQVDVAATLRALKDEVRRHRHELRGEGAIAADEWRGPTDLDAVQNAVRVNPHLPIAWPEWPPGIMPKIIALLQKVTRRLLRWYINPIIEQQNEFNAATAQALSDLVVEMRAGDARIEQRLRELESREAAQREVLAQRLWRLEQRTEPQPVSQRSAADAADDVGSDSPQPVTRTTPHVPRTTLDYYHFELRHRGSPEDIAARQALYLDYFRECRRVLDIGCGRGEFIALLREHDIDARGVDIDPDMVAHCQAEGLPVVQDDAIAHLATLPDESLDGAFMAQVVEHLAPAGLVELLRLCRQKLTPNGVLVAETINPTCVYAFVQYYLLDPSHAQPLHPGTLHFMLEDAGFWQTEVEYLSPVPAGARLSPLTANGLEAAQVSALNRNIERLNEFLFGYQDYAVIARRPPDELPEDDA
ncbi:MAG: putative S-adenosylmethionine-dependent methyltransferase [Anaerolineales bacterium]|nr:putative S-adenosylmethionine-dependent methyltransferase [Anaerolineales bacterium]